MKSAAYWRGWMRDAGQQVRQVREFVGLSQEALAKAAGISQGAVSRLEHGRGVATPLLIFLRVHLVLAEALRAFDREVLNDPARRMLDATRDISPAVEGVGTSLLPITRDAALDRVIQRYQSLTEPRRRAFAEVLDAAWAALTNEEKF